MFFVAKFNYAGEKFKAVNLTGRIRFSSSSFEGRILTKNEINPKSSITATFFSIFRSCSCEGNLTS